MSRAHNIGQGRMSLLARSSVRYTQKDWPSGCDKWHRPRIRSMSVPRAARYMQAVESSKSNLLRDLMKALLIPCNHGYPPRRRRALLSSRPKANFRLQYVLLYRITSLIDTPNRPYMSLKEGKDTCNQMWPTPGGAAQGGLSNESVCEFDGTMGPAMRNQMQIRLWPVTLPSLRAEHSIHCTEVYPKSTGQFRNLPVLLECTSAHYT